MTDDSRTLRLLDEALAAEATRAPDHLLASVLVGVRSAPQRGRWLRVPSRRATALVAACGLGVALLAVALAPRPGLYGVGTASPSPSASTGPSSSPSISPSPGASSGFSPDPSRAPVGPRPSGPPLNLDDGSASYQGSTVAFQLLTSEGFGVPVTFWLDGFGQRSPATDGPTISDWCAPTAGDRSIALPYMMGCQADLRFLRPQAVECGTSDDTPSVDELTAAILANEGLGAHDRGPVTGDPTLPARLFRGAVTGRVVDVGRARLFDRTASNPDDCEIQAGDKAIEVRGDMAATLIMLDFKGELVIIRLADGGYDRTTGIEAHDRGYGEGGTSAETFAYFVTVIHDISFE